MINHKHKKNKIEHNEEILREIRNRIMIEIWSIISTSQETTVITRLAVSVVRSLDDVM